MSKQKLTKWNWNSRRLKAAKLMATGDMTQQEIAKECNVRRETVAVWNMHPEFKEKVVELVLLDERATKAGILRRALTTLDKKSKTAADDKSTELEYLKFIADLMGITDHNPQVNITNAVGIVNSPEILEKANELSRKINQVYEAENGDNND